MAENELSNDPLEIAGGLEALLGQEYVSKGYVRFRIELVKAQTAVRDVLARFVRRSPCGTAGVQKKGTPAALDPREVPWDCGLLKSLLEGVSRAVGNWGSGSRDLARLSTAAVEDSKLLEQLAPAAAFGPDRQLLGYLSKRLEVSAEALLFFGRVLAAPFVAEAVDRLNKRRPAAPEPSGCCPFCGSPPGLAQLERQEGKRILFCSLCGQSWEFARLKCPFCGSQEKLGTLFLDQTDPRSIETCDQCKSYLKTVDGRKLPEGELVVPLVETTATVHLDMIAEKQGYARGLPYAALR